MLKNYLRLPIVCIIAACLQGCGSYEQSYPFANGYVSAENGGVFFLTSDELRPATILEGESSTKTLNSSITAYRLLRGINGKLSLNKLANKKCSVGACDPISEFAYLIPKDGGKSNAFGVELSALGAVSSATAFVDPNEEIQLQLNSAVCFSDTVESSAGSKLFKISPDESLNKVGYVVFGSTNRRSENDSRCLPIEALNLPKIANDAEKPEMKFFLVDAVRDTSGERHLLILGKDHVFDWDHDALFVASYSDGWKIDISPFGLLPVSPAPTRRYAFVDNTAAEVILALDSGTQNRARPSLTSVRFRIYNRNSRKAEDVVFSPDL